MLKSMGGTPPNFSQRWGNGLPPPPETALANTFYMRIMVGMKYNTEIIN